MAKSDPLESSFKELSKFFVGDKTMQDTLHRVATLAVDAMRVADFCGVTLLVDREPRTGVFTDPRSPEIDQSQYDSGRGPCLDSFRTGEIYRVDDTRHDGQWPEFRAACAQQGVLSTASFPMMVDGVRHGALNFYSTQSNAFGSDEIVLGRQFAAQAGVVVGYARSYWNARQLADNLATAMLHRAEIEQAKGIIVANTGCTPDEAFEVLVRQSQYENRKLRKIAAELVQSKVRRTER